jgi:hypothetical protein
MMFCVDWSSLISALVGGGAALEVYCWRSAQNESGRTPIVFGNVV